MATLPPTYNVKRLEEDAWEVDGKFCGTFRETFDACIERNGKAGCTMDIMMAVDCETGLKELKIDETIPVDVTIYLDDEEEEV